MSQGRRCDRYFTVCSLFWLGPETSEELAKEAAHDRICLS